MGNRIPLKKEPISGVDAVRQYDRGAKLYMMPEYKYFVRKILKKNIRSGRVLDIGTGSGLLAIELAKVKNCHFDITAVDISKSMISKARENAMFSVAKKKLSFINATAAALPFADNSFDLVISYASLHHWFEPVAVFNEIARVMSEAGQVIIRDNRRVYQNPLWKAVIWFVSRFMNRRHRKNWPKAILASYTIPEVRDILSKSKLNNCRVNSDFVFIDLCIEPQGKRGLRING